LITCAGDSAILGTSETSAKLGSPGAALLPCAGQDLAHQRRVVELGVALVAGARDVGAVQALAQRAVVPELHHRQVAGHLERELVAFLAFRFGGGAGGLHHVGRHAIELVGAA
jgi:hypothetical protein